MNKNLKELVEKIMDDVIDFGYVYLEEYNNKDIFFPNIVNDFNNIIDNLYIIIDSIDFNYDKEKIRKYIEESFETGNKILKSIYEKNNPDEKIEEKMFFDNFFNNILSDLYIIRRFSERG